MEIVWPAKAVFVYVSMHNTETLKAWLIYCNIDTVSWLGDPEVTHRTAVPQVPGSIPGSDTDIYVCFCVWLLHVNCFGHVTYFLSLNIGIPVATCMLFHLVNITYQAQSLWWIIRTLRYRHYLLMLDPLQYNSFYFASKKNLYALTHIAARFSSVGRAPD